MPENVAESDAECIVASKDAPERFGGIFDRHAEAILRYFVRRLGPDDADNLVGEVFRIAFQRRESFDSSQQSALPWLYGIAANQLANHRRSQTRRLRACAALAAQTQQSVSKESALEAGIVVPKLVDAIESLPDGERSALLLCALEDLSYHDIAVALDIPIGTVRSRINRARSRLRVMLEGGADETR